MKKGLLSRAGNRLHWRRRRPWYYLGLALVAVAFTVTYTVLAVFEGDLPYAWSWAVDLVTGVLDELGPWATVALLLIEEAGIPLVVPGDVFVMYIGHSLESPWQLGLAWAILVASVTAGASILYLISRCVGRRLAGGRVGKLLHLTPARLERAERWFRRHGAYAVIFGRHIPGGRIPITVAAGVLQVSYPFFAACVALSSAIWVAAFLVVGQLAGPSIAGLLETYGSRALWFAAGAAAALAVSWLLQRFLAVLKHRFSSARSDNSRATHRVDRRLRATRGPALEGESAP